MSDEQIDAWRVSPHMNTDYDYALFDCHVRAVEFLKELATCMLDNACEGDEFEIKIKHTTMTRHDYEECIGDDP